MTNITTTELRTKTPELIQALASGFEVNLIHRSKIIGRFGPVNDKPKPFNAKKFMETVKKLNLPHLSIAKRKQLYRQHLMAKYGQGLS